MMPDCYNSNGWNDSKTDIIVFVDDIATTNNKHGIIDKQSYQNTIRSTRPYSPNRNTTFATPIYQ